VAAWVGNSFIGISLACGLFRRWWPILGFHDGCLATIGIFDPWRSGLRQQQRWQLGLRSPGVRCPCCAGADFTLPHRRFPRCNLRFHTVSLLWKGARSV